MNRHQKIATILLPLALSLASCAGPRVVTLPDGSKLPAAPTYLSAKQMEQKGSNSYGVPAASFAFYPENYKGTEENLYGTKKTRSKRG